MHPNFAGGERGDNEALSAQTKALLDDSNSAFYLCLGKRFKSHLRFARHVVNLASSHPLLQAAFPQRFKAFKPLAARAMRPLHSPFADHLVGLSMVSNRSNYGA